MADYKELTPDKIQYLVVHCSATKPSMDVGVKEIRQWHLQRGFFDIGYHYVIRRDGTLEKGRPDTQPGAHVQGYNGKSLGVCMVGGVTQRSVDVAENNFTDDQWKTLKQLLSHLRATYPKAQIVGHRDLNKGKACPSFDVAKKLKEWGW